MTEQEEKNWILMIHLTGLLGSFAIVLGGLLIPLVLWLIKRDQSECVNDQGREVVNFQLSLIVCSLGIVLFCGVLILGLGAASTLFLVPLGILAMIALVLCQWIFGIIGAIRASEGVAYRYPLNLRMIG